jgi:hypothetical protein
MLEGAPKLLLPRDLFRSRSLSALRGQNLQKSPTHIALLPVPCQEIVSKSAVGKESQVNLPKAFLNLHFINLVKVLGN